MQKKQKGVYDVEQKIEKTKILAAAKNLLKAYALMMLLSAIWAVLELLMYHELQPRKVDDVMMYLMLPIFYRAVR